MHDIMELIQRHEGGVYNEEAFVMRVGQNQTWEVSLMNYILRSSCF